MRFTLPLLSVFAALPPSSTVMVDAVDSSTSLVPNTEAAPGVIDDAEAPTRALVQENETASSSTSLDEKYDKLLDMVDAVKQERPVDPSLPKQVQLQKEMESFSATAATVDEMISAILQENNDMMIPQFQDLLLSVQDRLAHTRDLAASIAEMEIAAMVAANTNSDGKAVGAGVKADGTVTIDVSDSASTKTKDLNAQVHSKLDPNRKVKSHPRFKRHFELHDAFHKGNHGFIKKKIDQFHNKAAPKRKGDNADDDDVDYEEDYIDESGNLRRRLAEKKTPKLEHCEAMVKCLSSWSLYDVVVYFYGPYVNDDGEISDDAAAADIDQGMFKQTERIANYLNGFDKRNFYNTKDVHRRCGDLLGQFHQIQNHDDRYLEYHGATWTSVCRAEGATKYIQFSEIREKVGASSESKAIADQVHEEYVGCAMKLGEKTFFSGSGAPRLPVALNDKARTGHYQPKKPFNSGNNFRFENLSVLNSAESTTRFDMPKEFAKMWMVGSRKKSIQPDYYVWSRKQNGWSGNSRNRRDKAKCHESVDKHYKDLFQKKSSLIFKDGKKRTYPDLRIKCRVTRDDTFCHVWAGKTQICDAAKFRNRDIGDRCPADSINGKFRVADPRRPWMIQNLRFPCDKERVYKVETIFRSASDTDKSTALLVGEKVSVGSVCAHAETTGKVPGYCCVDEPFQRGGDAWGYDFTCEDGLRGPRRCRNRVPGLAGFSQEACSAYSGTFCAYHRDCTSLKQCVADEIKWATSKKKQAYLAYVSDAPELVDTGSAEQCGLVREYFGFESDFPDDDEICEDIGYLREKTQFDSLDSFLGGGSGNGGEIAANDGGETEELNKPAEPEVKENNLDKLSKTIYVFEQSLNSLEEVYEIAADFECPEDLTGGVKTVCAAAKNILVVVAVVAFFISKRILASLSDSYPGFGDYGMYEIYTQVMVSFDNMVILNEGIAAIKEQNVDNTKAVGDHIDDRTDSLKDYMDTKSELMTAHIDSVCSGTGTKRHLSKAEPSTARNAGCDGLDQDGDGFADNCEEDLFPPTLSFSSALELIDNDVTSQLNGGVFRDAEAALGLVRGASTVVDDCASAKDLDLNIAIQETGVCQSTISLTPVQKCHGEEMAGLSKEIVVQMDTEAPTVTCGFHGSQLPGKKTLVVEEGTSILDAGLFYHVDDSCSRKVTMDLLVAANEFDGSSDNVFLAKSRDQDGVSVPKVFFKPSRCASYEGGFCVKDSIEQRFYEITVKATDEAGWTGTDVCRVIVVPKKQERDARELRGGAASRLSETEAKALVDASSERYEIASTSWTAGLNLN